MIARDLRGSSGRAAESCRNMLWPVRELTMVKGCSQMLLANDPTPCGVMFSLFKRYGGITHRELADLILSERPLPSGKTPLELARDRSWLSHSIVHAPVGTLQERFFRDFGSAAVRVMSRLKSRRGKAMSAEEIISMLTGEPGRAMDRSLELCHQDARLYRNALVRLAGGEGLVPGERAEAALVLFIATSCSANVRKSVSYALDYAKESFGRCVSTPTTDALARQDEVQEPAENRLELGLLRVKDSYVAGDPHWLPRSEDGVEIGSLVMGERDVTDVGADVSGRHARVWLAEKNGTAQWFVEDLGSKNGTVLVSGADHSRVELRPGVPAELRPGDELVLAGDTSFVAIEGIAG